MLRQAQDLIKRGRHLCYGMQPTEQIIVQLKRAVSDKDTLRIQKLLDEAQEIELVNPAIENARDFLAMNSNADDWNSQMRRSRVSTVHSIKEGAKGKEKEGTPANSIEARFQKEVTYQLVNKPFEDFPLLRREGNGTRCEQCLLQFNHPPRFITSSKHGN